MAYSTFYLIKIKTFKKLSLTLDIYLQVCTCLRQLPVLCRTVLCAPPQGCRSLRVGDACCEWVCDQWDDSVTGSVSDLGLRLMASAITAIFSLSLLFFLIYRLRQRKLRGRQNHLEAEGYSQEEIFDEAPGHSFHLDLMKPHDRVMMRRPFPPTYSEAMCGIRPNGNLGTMTLSIGSVRSSRRCNHCLSLQLSRALLKLLSQYSPQLSILTSQALKLYQL